jgi:hypothetical protein
MRRRCRDWRSRRSTACVCRPSCRSTRRTPASTAFPAARGGPGLLPAAGTLRGRRVLRHRGRPVLGRRGPRVPARHLDRRGRLRADLGARRARGAQGVRALDGLDDRAPRCLPGRARLPLQPLRADRAQAADVEVRHPRGRARRAAAPRGLRRPLHGRAPSDARRRAALLAEEHGGVLSARARRRGDRGRRLDPRLPGVAGVTRTGQARRDRRVQRRRLPLDTDAARLAARRARRGRADLRDRAAQPRRQTGPRADRACSGTPVRTRGSAGAPDGRRRRAHGRPRRARAPPPVGRARVPPAREQAGVVGVLRADDEDAARARRGRQRGARRPDPRDRPRVRRGEAVVDLPAALPAAGAQGRAGQRPSSPRPSAG